MADCPAARSVPQLHPSEDRALYVCRVYQATPPGWDSDEWEQYCLLILRQRHGDRLVPVPDKSGGDGGLEAFTQEGAAYQCYAPENEPLKPKTRYELQRGKITKDLKKLDTYRVRVQELLGDVALVSWVLLTPRHEAADLVAHCQAKAREVVALGLPFISSDFCVSVQTLADFEVEHRLVQSVGFLPGSLSSPISRPHLHPSGIPFSEVEGHLIGVMDSKLAHILADETSRAYYRGELLRGQVAGDDLVGRFRDRVPDVAFALDRELDAAKRAMLMNQALTPDAEPTRLQGLLADIVERVQQTVPQLSRTNAEMLAEAAICRWLQECSLHFGSSAAPASVGGGEQDG